MRTLYTKNLLQYILAKGFINQPNKSKNLQLFEGYFQVMKT